MPYFLKMNFQEFNNFNMMNMMFFHDSMNSVLILILTMIFIKLSLIMKKNIFLNLKIQKESNSLEIFWTIIPSMMIFFISFPSLMSLYLNEEMKKTSFDLLIMGNQWYWSYNYPNNLKLNCYICNSLINRNLSTDFSMILPTKTFIRLSISSNDVIHSWTIPSLMTKMDAIPGRINSNTILSSKSMKLKGQCSEICGSNHSFMPISMMFLNFSSN